MSHKEIKECDTIKRHEQKNNTPDKAKLNQKETDVGCKYCGKTHELQRCPAFSKICSRCRKCKHCEIIGSGQSR